MYFTILARDKKLRHNLPNVKGLEVLFGFAYWTQKDDDLSLPGPKLDPRREHSASWQRALAYNSSLFTF